MNGGLGTPLDTCSDGRGRLQGVLRGGEKDGEKSRKQASVIDFSFGSLTYQIDTERQKVYRRFVEIETSRAATIYSNWRASTV
jgi:hypothetical protein